jgi:hypothetical protein
MDGGLLLGRLALPDCRNALGDWLAPWLWGLADGAHSHLVTLAAAGDDAAGRAHVHRVFTAHLSVSERCAAFGRLGLAANYTLSLKSSPVRTDRVHMHPNVLSDLVTAATRTVFQRRLDRPCLVLVGPSESVALVDGEAVPLGVFHRSLVNFALDALDLKVHGRAHAVEAVGQPVFSAVVEDGHRRE